MINHQAEIVAFKLTTGNRDDHKIVPEMIGGIKGKAFADREVISE
ncbi:transposase, partial [Candidatus Protochlamydia sp. W-9]